MKSDNDKIVSLDGTPIKHEMEVRDFLEENVKKCAEFDHAFVYMGSKDGNINDSMTWVGMGLIEAIGILSVLQTRMGTNN